MIAQLHFLLAFRRMVAMAPAMLKYPDLWFTGYALGEIHRRAAWDDRQCERQLEPFRESEQSV